MEKKSLFYYLHKLWLGLTLRCPHCGKGKTFTGLFKFQRVCPDCGVRFERLSGESVGGMYINLGAAELLSIVGYFVFEALFHPPFWFQMTFWIAFNVIFVLLFYRHSRSLWVAIAYLTGGVYTDTEHAAKMEVNKHL
jgi:uncharacterized protein (DUF983 family)